MRSLSDAELLNVWERGLGQSAVHRALVLLGAVFPEATADELAQWSVGRRDAALWHLRARLFGPRLVSLATCPDCGQDAELNLETTQIVAANAAANAAAEPTLLELELPRGRAQFRPPNSLDLLAADEAASSDDARRVILGRCLVAWEGSDEPTPARDLPEELATAIAQRMADADPLADVRLTGDCPHCGVRWQAPFDIVQFLWLELSAWARRQLHTVHLLASAYGWREAEILALSETRRNLYLELIE